MVDKNYCMSSYLAFRFVEREDVQFKSGLKHTLDMPVPEEKRVLVRNAQEIAEVFRNVIQEREKVAKLGILLSGGMDSACVAAFLKPGTDAYTFRFLGGTFNKEELERAEYYAKKYKLNLHYVDINWEVVERNVDILMKQKGAPVHSIEPQIYEACLQAKKDGVEQIVVGESADLVFGGMDKQLSKDWTVDEFAEFYTYVDPRKVLKNPVDISYVYERYRLPNNKFDFIRFGDEIFAHESSASYCNAVITAKMKYIPYVDPSAHCKMAEPLDLKRVRSGESKYLVRDLFKICYPDYPVPNKIPMPRPVDEYFKDWKGPTRDEFLPNLDMSQFNGNQKWLIYCLERFLNLMDEGKI